mgnify:CR=1 FL=1
MKTSIVIILAVAVILVAICFWRSRKGVKKEGYDLAAGAVNNLGSFLDNQYDLIDAPDAAVPSAHFADLVDDNKAYMDTFTKQPAFDKMNKALPGERLEALQGSSAFPRVAGLLPMVNADVANPSTYSYFTNASRATTALKSKYKCYDQACFIRGDILITSHPEIPLITKSRLGRNDQRLDGLFSDQFKAKFDKYTGQSYKNMVQHVAGAGQASGYGGASAATIMDM